MSTGTITRLVRDRGFGFVREDGKSEEIFFHRSAVEQTDFDSLTEGQKVAFDTEADPKQPQRSRAAHLHPES